MSDKVITMVDKTQEFNQQAWVNSAKEFAQEIEAGEVTHAIIAYRSKDGAVNYRTFNADHITYLLGIMERTKYCIQRELEDE